MTDLAVRFARTTEETFYKILAALASMKGEGIGKVKFEEIKGKWSTNWYGEIQFLSEEAMEIFGKKIRGRTRSSNA